MESGLNKAINGKTKISFLIKANPLVIETLANFNAHFKKLRNPVLRNLLVSRITITEACKIGGCKVNEFLEKMAEIGFTIDYSDIPQNVEPPATTQPPVFLLSETVLELDVRPILAQNHDPLKVIIEHINNLLPGQCFKIINSFEPVPLINMLARKGFQYYIEHHKEEIVITYFIKPVDGQQVNESLPDNAHAEFDKVLNSFAPDKIHILDVRKLEMPLPMITILERLQNIIPGEALFVYHKKVPVFLLPVLKERGLDFLVQHTPDNAVNILIFKP